MLKPLAAALAVAACALLPSSVLAAETLKLDLASPANATVGAAAVSSSPLVADQTYVVTVSGTGSLWSPVETPAPVTCGAPEAAPIVEPTPGKPEAVPTVDAALIFAAPVGVSLWDTLACSGPNPAVPPAPSGLRMGVGGALAPALPIGGLPAAASPTHTYAYSVKGTGAPLEFQLFDVRPDDNSGILTIVIRSEAECGSQSCLTGLIPPPGTQVMLPGTGSPGATSPTSAGAAPQSGTVADPSACLASNVLSVRLVAKKGQIYTKAVYWINGKKKAKVTGKKLYVARRATTSRKSKRELRVQKFRVLPTGSVVLKVMAKTKGGKVLRTKKVYYRCAATSKKAKPIKFSSR